MSDENTTMDGAALQGGFCPECSDVGPKVVGAAVVEKALSLSWECLSCGHAFSSIENFDGLARAKKIERAYDAGLLIPHDLRLPAVLGMPITAAHPEYSPFPVGCLKGQPAMDDDRFSVVFGTPPVLMLLTREEAEERERRSRRMDSAELAEVISEKVRPITMVTPADAWGPRPNSSDAEGGRGGE